MTSRCTNFESQSHLKDRCKNCFSHKDKHADDRQKEKRKSWKSSLYENGAPDDDEAESLSVSSYISANSKGMSSTRSCESFNDTKSLVTAFSGSIYEEERALTPTEKEINEQTLKAEIAQLQDINKSLRKENAQWLIHQKMEKADGAELSLISMLQDRLNNAENLIQDFRDENTVLKCELRELQDAAYDSSDKNIKEKIRSTETFCDELMEENEQLKSEIKDLQQEIEEMQDQYREEEIEEFRELQRDLEQNAKNCRVLQFKLRKMERQKDKAETERNISQQKLEEYIANSQTSNTMTGIKTDIVKIKDLESELRIAKEVSLRLHNELENAEEKRCKLEDEVFYLKETIREIQTQNKWRESRNKTDIAVKRLSAELTAPIPNIGSEAETNKDLRDALEREFDAREQLRFAEENLQRTQIRIQDLENENEELLKKLSKACKARPPMTRSSSDGNAHLQLELAESQVEHLSSKVERLEKTNDHLNKKIIELEIGKTSLVSDFKLPTEIEQDMARMISKISDLERKNFELSTLLKQNESKSIQEKSMIASPNVAAVKKDQDRIKLLESQILDLKAILLKSDNNKIITLATKIEQLNAHINLLNDRCTNLHKKQLKQDKNSYEDELKRKIEDLELKLSELMANNTIAETQEKVATTDEVEQCCEVLAAVESQTNRLLKVFEKLDGAQKDERRRSLSKDNGATIIADIANIMQELKEVHSKLNGLKTEKNDSTIKKEIKNEDVSAQQCGNCANQKQIINEQVNEISFYKKKNKDLTNQILQSEDRWTIEIEKQRQIFENEIKTLGLKISDSKRQIDELTELLESKSTTLVEKSRYAEEQEERNKKLRNEVESLKNEIQDMETDKKNVKEFEIKYNKLESIFESEREKMNIERNKMKNNLNAIKKLKEESDKSLKLEKEKNQEIENNWKAEVMKLEKEINSIKESCIDTKSNIESNDRVVSTTFRKSPTKINESKCNELENTISTLKTKLSETENNLNDIKIENADLKDQLKKIQFEWKKDKEAYQHKIRQTEKLRSVEIDAMQQKFSSRMRIMEDTNKSLHSQLVLARRERDSHKETVTAYEKTISDEKNNQKNYEKTSIELKEKINDLNKLITSKEEELVRLQTDLRLTKEARKADQILWNIDRSQVRNSDNNDVVEKVRLQYKESEAFYTKEMERLNKKLTEMTRENKIQKNESTKIIRNLQEQIKIMEIEQKNLDQNKVNEQVSKEMIESERERLQQLVHLNELQKLTRKYRLSSIIDQLTYISDAHRKSSKEGESDGMRYIISQLIAVRDDDPQPKPTTYDPDDTTLGENYSIDGYRPSSECGEGTYDNISQSSFSIKSFSGMPFRSGYSGKYNSVDYGKRADSQDYLSSEINNSRKTSFDKKKVANDNKSRRMDSEIDKSMQKANSQGPAGSSILCRVRREELARGGQPSVKLMAKAFDSFDEAENSKNGFYVIRKSRSVDNAPKEKEDSRLKISHKVELSSDNFISNYGTLPREGRNPFKNMGTRLVERVRRSLSRSSRQSREDKEEDVEYKVSKKIEKGNTSPKKTKKKSAASKARKCNSQDQS